MKEHAGPALVAGLVGSVVAVAGLAGFVVSAYYLVVAIVGREESSGGSMNADLMEGLIFMTGLGTLASAAIAFGGVMLVRRAFRQRP
jgi:hypothetical protein